MYRFGITNAKQRSFGPATALRGAGITIFLLLISCASRAQVDTNSLALTETNCIWSAGVGEGFRRGAEYINLSGGAGLGMRMLGGRRIHDWWLVTAQYGYVLSDVVAGDHFYRGNWELLSEGFAGEQFSPSHSYLAGIMGGLRYNFATGTRIVPFFDAGGGLTSTSIRNGDLSSTFEFNLQAGAGAHVFLTDQLALTSQYRFIHVSNANTAKPNLGVNNSTFLLGLSWFF